jgi:hypothetical protein
MKEVLPGVAEGYAVTVNVTDDVSLRLMPTGSLPAAPKDRDPHAGSPLRRDDRGTARPILCVWNKGNLPSGRVRNHRASGCNAVQTPNAQHLRSIVKPLFNAQSALFPSRLSDACAVILANQLPSEVEYLAWLVPEAERRGIDHLPELILESYRRIYLVAVQQVALM